MSNELFHAAKQIFCEALSRPALERKAYAAKACAGDEALLHAVNRLLEANLEVAGGPFLKWTPTSKAPVDDPLRGQRLGSYTLVEPIGEGSMGVVYRARQDQPARDVAVKLIHPHLLSRRGLDRFRRETEILGKLWYPDIAKVFEAGTARTRAGELPFIALELVRGQRLDLYVKEEKPQVDVLLRLLGRIADAVDYAHQNGVIHRDLKPANILVTDNGEPRVLDFGVAKLSQEESDGATGTRTGVPIGTIAYMSPEQTMGRHRELDGRSDVYSLGVIAYELLAGRRPHDADHSLELLEKIRTEMPVRLGSLQPRLRGDVDTIVHKALAKERGRRYATPREFADDLRRHLSGEAVLARPPNPMYRLRKFVRRHRALASATVAVFVALLAGAIVALVFALEAARQRNDVLRLSDRRLVEDYRREAASLWPAVPDRIGELESWLAKAHELLERLPGHRVRIETLREEARRSGSGKSVRVPRPDLEEELAGLRSRRSYYEELLKGKLPGKPAALALKRIDARVAQIETQLEATTWEFENPALQWQHDVLDELIRELEHFATPDPFRGTVASVERRLTRARASEKLQSTKGFRDAWEKAIASIADEAECPAYRGLSIRPQVGLLPIGRDPDSGLWEFAVLQTGTVPRRGKDGKLLIDDEAALVLVLLPGGETRLGAVPPGLLHVATSSSGRPHVDPDAYPDEGPVRTVTLQPFFVSKYEMTQGQWQRVTGSNPSLYRAGTRYGNRTNTLRNPVEMLTWGECREVLSRHGLVLPSEDQWEYAARGGTSTIWSTGNRKEDLAGAANLADQEASAFGPASLKPEEWNDGWVTHAAVGSFAPNPFGLHDVHGNVYEWCADWHLDNEQRDTELREKIYRGGCFRHPASDARSSARFGGIPTKAVGSIGVRPARPVR